VAIVSIVDHMNFTITSGEQTAHDLGLSGSDRRE
jgi:hypothetical protein